METVLHLRSAMHSFESEYHGIVHGLSFTVVGCVVCILVATLAKEGSELEVVWADASARDLFFLVVFLQLGPSQGYS